ncbi:uncharacterized protein LOC130780468 [Actinidia eriantha]|uniref:uncharacterized protein LOC130780468 n=1 Tax=Actinidia eriantha TaxID=165200 RepID=UPI0025902BB9|nr:uncharacterized protein LOC130780468 [Actinidia eriantha]
MSTSIEPPPPPLEVTQQAYTTHSGHGSIGPVIGVLAVITILGAIAVMIGRLCSGRRILGHGHYNFEGWVENKCGSCIDGRVDPPPRPPPLPAATERASSSSAVDAPPAADAPQPPPQEAKEEEITQQDPSGSARS